MKKRATMYTKDNCPYCTVAAGILEDHGIEFDEVKLGRDMDRDSFLSELTEKIGKKPSTVPQIFLDGKHVGGADDLNEFLNS